MKGFSTSITKRFQPICKPKNQTGNGFKPMVQNQDKPQSEDGYEANVNIEKSKKRSKKHKKRKREYQSLEY